MESITNVRKGAVLTSSRCVQGHEKNSSTDKENADSEESLTG